MSRSGYWALPEGTGNADEGTEVPPVFVETGRRAGKGQWSQITDLDDFFSRVYRYHQRHGFLAILCEDCLKLMQYMFVVVFSIYLAQCVNYQTLFHIVEKGFENRTIPYGRVSLSDTVIDLNVCLTNTSNAYIAGVTLAMFIWLFWLVKILHSAVKNWEVRRFYYNVLSIYDSVLPDLTWNKDVLPKIIQVQQEVELCVHKSTLTELDVCQRILRFNNYMVALVYRVPEPLLPLKLNVSCIGTCFYISTGLRTCLEMVLFWRGPWSPFDSSWHLRDEYRRAENRERLASGLRKRAIFVGIMNLLLLPIIFVWQLLYLFLSYTTLIRKDPAWLGSRRWSVYGRLYGRLFNELDHQLDSRLSRAYDHARKYMASFPPHPLIIIMCRGLVFFSSSILAVLLVLTLIDDDVLHVDGMLLLMTSLGIIATMAGTFLPDENLVYAPDMLLTDVQRHYRHLPNEWLPKAHDRVIRDEFASLFQYKAVWLLEEIASPFVSAYILLFKFRTTALPIVDFFRNFTIDVVGVGDVCSFAMMNFDAEMTPPAPPGQPSQQPRGASSGGVGYGATKPGAATISAYGLQQAPPEAKAEMSLAQFALANPGWRPTGGQNQRSIVSKVRTDAAEATSALQQQALSSMMPMSPGLAAAMPSSSHFRVDPLTLSNLQHPSAMSLSAHHLRGAGLSKMDDMPSIVQPVMDRRHLAMVSSAESALRLPVSLAQPTQRLSGSDIAGGGGHAMELDDLTHPNRAKTKKDRPMLIQRDLNEEDDDDEEIARQPLLLAVSQGPDAADEGGEDPFASLVPLGLPVWSPPVDSTIDLHPDQTQQQQQQPPRP